MTLTIAVDESTKVLSLRDDTAKHVLKALHIGQGAAATEAYRFTITLVRVQFEDGQMIVTSTNSYRAVRVTVSLLDDTFNGLTFWLNQSDIKELVPKHSVLKKDSNGLTLSFTPGRAKLDPGQLTLSTATTAARVGTYPESDWPNIDQYFDELDKHSGESVAFNPKYVADICKDILLLSKDTIVIIDSNDTAMKHQHFRSNNIPGVDYLCTLMPVRIP